MRSTSACKITTVLTATPAAAMAVAGRIMAISLEGGSNASSVDVFDHATVATGTMVFSMSVGTALSQFYDFSNLGGIPCANGAWVVPTGTGAICYIWTE